MDGLKGEMKGGSSMQAGIEVQDQNGGSLMKMRCPHLNATLYVIPSPGNWVCSDHLRPGHGLAGFMKELTALENPQVKELMQRWGLYFRTSVVEEEAN